MAAVRLAARRRAFHTTAAARSAVSDICSAIAALHRGDQKPEDVWNDCLSRRRASEPAINAFVRTASNQSASATGILTGIPIGVKDNFAVEGIEMSCGSKILEGYRPPYDATVVSRLRGAGASLAGKTNMDEFAMGSSTTFSAAGATVNPHSHAFSSNDERRVAGGSSGGSAAAVAAGAVLAALGSDTGGSVRQPGSLCGVVGFKPTYGRLSRWGLVAFASSLDTPGLLTRSVADAALLFDALSGHDAADDTSARIDRVSLPRAEDIARWCESSPTTPPTTSSSTAFTPELLAPRRGERTSLSGMRVGIPREASVDGLSSAAREAWSEGVAWLEDAGAQVVPVSIPSWAAALSAYYIIAPAEAASNLARYDGVRYGRRVNVGRRGGPGGDLDEEWAADADGDMPESDAAALHEMYTATRTEGFGEEVRRRLLVGNFVLSESVRANYYDQAVAVRRRIAREVGTVFSAGVDALLTPTAPSEAWTLSDAEASSPVRNYLMDVFTIPFSLAGLPSISVPAAYNGERMPVGLQLVGPALSEPSLVRMASALEGYAQFELPEFQFPELQERRESKWIAEM